MRVVVAAALAGVVAIGAAAGGFYVAATTAPSGAAGLPFAHAGKPKAIPELRFLDGAGRTRSLGEFKGRFVLLNIWATWCAPCREEMPALDRLQTRLGGPDFEVVALSIDQQGLETVRKFFGETGIKSLQPFIDPSAQAAFKLGAPGVPSTLLVDRAGREVGRHSGPAKWDAPEIIDNLAHRIKEGSGR